MATDYDCWKESEEAVSVQAVIENLNANSSNAQKLLMAVLPTLERALEQNTLSAIKSIQGSNQFAIITAGPKRNPETAKKLEYILPGYFHA